MESLIPIKREMDDLKDVLEGMFEAKSNKCEFKKRLKGIGWDSGYVGCTNEKHIFNDTAGAKICNSSYCPRLNDSVVRLVRG